MIELMNRLSLDYEFVDAIDGECLSEAELSLYDRRRSLLYYGTEMTRAEVACFLSHQRVYKQIVAESVSTALVLEDDVEIDEDLEETCRSLCQSGGWKIVRLQATRWDVLGATGKGAGALVRAAGQRFLYRIDGHVLGACGYLITQAGARRLLAYAPRAFLPIDHAMDRFWENGIIPFVVRPCPIRPSGGIASDIGLRGRDVFRPSSSLAAIKRRVRRLLDGLAKRLFTLSLRHPQIGRLLGGAGVSSARIALGARDSQNCGAGPSPPGRRMIASALERRDCGG